MDRFDIVPPFRQKRSQEIQTFGDILSNLVDIESINAYRLSQPREFLNSESDSIKQFFVFFFNGLVFRDRNWQFTDLSHISTNNFGDIFGKRV